MLECCYPPGPIQPPPPTMKSALNFDHHAHTPLDPLVHQALCRAFVSHDVNVHAGSHAGEATRAAVEAARREVAELLNVDPSEIIFTSGATESNNLALVGLRTDSVERGRTQIVLGAGEHLSVLKAGTSLEGFEVVLAPLQRDGAINLEELARLVTPRTALVSIAAANHETGVIQPVKEIGKLAHSAGALFHSDLAQAAGRIEVDMSEVDLASLSAHKLHGPMGIGALFARRAVRRRMHPLISGGSQEGGLRAGTLPAPLCIAFGLACKIAQQRRCGDAERLAALRGRLLVRLKAGAELKVNGRTVDRLPNNLNLSFEGVDGEALVMHVRDRLTIATGSACTSEALEPSHVLLAMGLSRSSAESAIRIGLGRDATEDDIDDGADILLAAVNDLLDLRRRRRA